MSASHLIIATDQDIYIDIYEAVLNAARHNQTVILIAGMKHALYFKSYLQLALDLEMRERTLIIDGYSKNISTLFMQITSALSTDMIVVSNTQARLSSETYERLERATSDTQPLFAFPIASLETGLDSINIFSSPSVGIARNTIAMLGRLRPSTPATFLDTLKAELYRYGEGIVVASAGTADATSNTSRLLSRYLGETPILSVLVPTLDASSSKAQRLVASLKASTTDPFQLVLVDNGNAPQGFSVPVNTAIRACDTPYIAVINDDVQVLPNWWEPLRRAIDQGEYVVFPTTIEGTRADFSAWCFAMSRDSMLQIAYSRACFFDPELLVYFQDSDLLMRLRQKGKPPKHVSESFVSHSFSASVATNESDLRAWIDKTVISDRNRFVDRWGLGALEEVGYIESAS
jgi:hypothetical protein